MTATVSILTPTGNVDMPKGTPAKVTHGTWEGRTGRILARDGAYYIMGFRDSVFCQFVGVLSVQLVTEAEAAPKPSPMLEALRQRLAARNSPVLAQGV